MIKLASNTHNNIYGGDTMDWVKNLQRFKEEQNVTYKDISDRAGLPYATVEKIIKGRSKDPKLMIIHKIVTALGYTLNELMDDTGSNAVISDDEKYLISIYRKLDTSGKELIDSVFEHEYERMLSSQKSIQINGYTKIFYDVPVSAGTGQYLDNTTAKKVTLYNEPPHGTDYILRISGDSMEPDYHDGDYVYVQKAKFIDEGEIGIFVYDGNVYMKEYSHNGLRSLNPAYELIQGSENIKCLGKVLGVLKETPYINK